MKTMGNLSPAVGSNHTKKRLGRGIGSGLGKTAGKGHKGQKARKSGGVGDGFEGGQTPLFRRIPKHGFKNTENKKHYTIIKSSQLKAFADGATVDAESLLKLRVVDKIKYPVKILWDGPFSKKVTVKVAKVSQKAKAAIVDAGGAVEEI